MTTNHHDHNHAPAKVAPAILAAADGEEQVLTLLRQGSTVPAVSDATTWPAAAIRKLAARHGLLIGSDAIAYAPDAAYYAQRVDAVTQAGAEELLRLAADCPDAKVQRAKNGLLGDVDALREHLAAYERRTGELAMATHTAAEARLEVDRLATQLQQAKSRLREASQTLGRRGAAKGPATKPGGSARRYQPGTDYTTPQARAWAKANGYAEALPKYGRYVPDHVIDAMRAAHNSAPPVQSEARSSAARQEVAA